MNPRLEELRKRLLEPPLPATPPRHTIARRARDVSSPRQLSDEASAVGFESEERDVGEERPQPTDSRAGLSSSGAGATDGPRPADALARAVGALFEPARQCQGRLAEIAEATESINRLARLAAEVRQPLENFRDHIRRLSASFESMRTFRDELGILAESFEPVRALHEQVIELSDTVQAHLAEIANGLEPARALRVRIADLGDAMDSVSELQSQFFELSGAFASPAKPRGLSAEENSEVESDA